MSAWLWVVGPPSQGTVPQFLLWTPTVTFERVFFFFFSGFFFFWSKFMVFNVLIYFLKYHRILLCYSLKFCFPSPLYSPPPCIPLPTHIPPLFSSCPWVISISSLASTFPIPFLTSSCLFSTYHLCYLFSVPFLPFSPSQSPADNPPGDLHFCDSVPVLVVCLLCFCFGIFFFRFGC